jgi:ADP-ribose pyrophosphatase
MGMNNYLLRDYQLHKKARTEKHSAYPDRFVVPDDKVKWQTNYPEYNPVEFNAPIVLDINTKWADPQDIRKVSRVFTSFEGEVKFNNNIPLNPFGRTGLAGRGVLGKWGANFAVDGVITTIHPKTLLFQVLTIVRGDTGETAFPGGMVDLNESVFETRNRELKEELSMNENDLSNPQYEKVVNKGYVDDPRNTDNSWIETSVIHSHFLYERVESMVLSAGDDAKDFKWVDVTPINISNFYANHGFSLLMALDELLKSDCLSIDGNLREQTRKIINDFGLT